LAYLFTIQNKKTFVKIDRILTVEKRRKTKERRGDKMKTLMLAVGMILFFSTSVYEEGKASEREEALMVGVLLIILGPAYLIGKIAYAPSKKWVQYIKRPEIRSSSLFSAIFLGGFMTLFGIFLLLRGLGLL